MTARIHKYSVNSGGSRADDEVELCEGCGAQLQAEMNGQATKEAKAIQENAVCEWCSKANFITDAEVLNGRALA
jgi:hypothetical protein